MKQERLSLSTKEQERIRVVGRVIGAAANGKMTNEEASKKLGLCRRQVIRLKWKYREHGEMGLIHGNHGRSPKHRISDETRGQIVQLYREKYYDFNFSHFAERLKEEEGISVSRSAAAVILKEAGFKSKKGVKRRPKLHRARPRRAAAGMLWQTDATPFEWFGKGNGYATLHAYIDDATGTVVGAWFTKNECTEGYVAALSMGVEKYGLPMEIYSDRHTIFRSPKKLSEEDKAEGKEAPLSNFGLGLKELGVGQIFALTPEAKGRVERLWNTLQDRLPGELRLMGVTTIEGANKALPQLLARHNMKFSASPAEAEDVYDKHEEKLDMEFIFARRETRKTDHGGTISWINRRYAPAEAGPGELASVEVEVRETLSGKVWVVYKGQRIEMKEIEKPQKAAVSEKAVEKRGEPAKGHKPAPNHPWRQYGLHKRIRKSAWQESGAAAP